MLEQRGIGTMDRRGAMDDVVVRHALKLYQRISRYLASDAPVQVPSNVTANLDGRHAEVRIIHMPGWDSSTHYPPTGTMYACMGCFLHFLDEHIEIGRWMGPMWVTNPALSTQLTALLQRGVKMGKFPPQDVQRVGNELLAAYDRIPPHAHMGKGRTKSGTSGFDRRADSDSEVDDDEYAELQERLKARREGNPMSPQWLGMSSGWEPDSPSSSGMSNDEEEAQAETPLDRFRRGEAPMSHEDTRTALEGFGWQMREFVPPGYEEPPRRQIDVFKVNGTAYAANDPRIRSGGECLWDTLRHYGFSDEELATAAHQAGLTVDQHVFRDAVWGLVQRLATLRGRPLRLVLDTFFIDGRALSQIVAGQSDVVLHIGLMADPQSQGHYVPRWA
jgi:hypothetical protein